MCKITYHSKQRILQRNDGVNNFAEAKRMAKIAKRSGAVINDYRKFPKFFSYLQTKRNQTRSCAIRIYKGCIYIWRGKDILMTAYQIPERFREELLDENLVG